MEKLITKLRKEKKQGKSDYSSKDPDCLSAWTNFKGNINTEVIMVPCDPSNFKTQ